MQELKLSENLTCFGFLASVLAQTPQKVIRDTDIAFSSGFSLNHIHEDHWKLVEMRGFEPLTSSLRTRRSPN
jgi:hypothetical protein